MKPQEKLIKVTNQNEQSIPPIDSLPSVFRIDSINCEPRPNGNGFVYKAQRTKHA